MAANATAANVFQMLQALPLLSGALLLLLRPARS
jgi:hypothetical protein